MALRRIILLISCIAFIFILYFVYYIENKRYERINSFCYLKLTDSCYVVVKSSNYDRGWTEVVSKTNDSLLFSIDFLGLELLEGDILHKKSNSDSLYLFRKKLKKTFYIDYNKKLDPKVNLNCMN